jgi:hypothetical protein
MDIAYQERTFTHPPYGSRYHGPEMKHDADMILTIGVSCEFMVMVRPG